MLWLFMECWYTGYVEQVIASLKQKTIKLKAILSSPVATVLELNP
jgi:hypothetical protein